MAHETEKPAPPAARHGLHYTSFAETWDEALPLGNGMLGALIWGDGRPLRISLDRADLWDLRPIAEFDARRDQDDELLKFSRRKFPEGREYINNFIFIPQEKREQVMARIGGDSAPREPRTLSRSLPPRSGGEG